MYQPNMETLLKLIPNKEISKFKNILSSRGDKDIELFDHRNTLWQYWGFVDNVTLNTRDDFSYRAVDFPEKLSDTMYIFDDLVVFVEHKGVMGYVNPAVKLLSLCKGFIRIDR